jgi:uncharacterized Zn-binding protein involved in type VI secretion
MSDKLKLGDGHGDAEIEKISQAKEMDEVSRRVRELEQNIARLKALQAERERAAREVAAPVAAGNNKIGARKHAGFKAISTAPSINKTPIGPSMVPLPYPTVQDLSNSASPARSVRFNGAPAYLLDGTTQPKCTGDEPGTGKGIRSGTVSGEVKPVKGSSTVRIEGKQVVREGDACTMNGGNNPGIYVTTAAPSWASPKDAIKTEHPPTTLDTPEEKSAFRKWLAQAEDDIRQAAKHPVEGVKGATKGIVNIVPGTMELLLKVSAEQRATELGESAMTLGIFGQTGAATALSEAASGTRKNADNTDLPKLTMSNQAQKGGDTISTAIQLFAAGVGMLKGGAKLLGGLGKAGKAAEAAKAAEVASGVGKIDKAAGAAAGPAGDGVKIAGANSTSHTFKTGEDVIHFERHGSEIAQTLGYENYSLSQYVQDANSVIANGTFVPELNAYVSISGGTGSAKGLMVGLDRATGEITTMHMKPVPWFETKAPSLGWEAQPKTVRTNTVGPNPQSGWKLPY